MNPPAIDAGAVREYLLGLQARIVALPSGRDPNSYFAAGATASDFVARMEQAQAI